MYLQHLIHIATRVDGRGSSTRSPSKHSKWQRRSCGRLESTVVAIDCVRSTTTTVEDNGWDKAANSGTEVQRDDGKATTTNNKWYWLRQIRYGVGPFGGTIQGSRPHRILLLIDRKCCRLRQIRYYGVGPFGGITSIEIDCVEFVSAVSRERDSTGTYNSSTPAVRPSRASCRLSDRVKRSEQVFRNVEAASKLIQQQRKEGSLAE